MFHRCFFFFLLKPLTLLQRGLINALKCQDLFLDILWVYQNFSDIVSPELECALLHFVGTFLVPCTAHFPRKFTIHHVPNFRNIVHKLTHSISHQESRWLTPLAYMQYCCNAASPRLSQLGNILAFVSYYTLPQSKTHFTWYNVFPNAARLISFCN